ncbi:hypothetical protein NE547_15640 [Flavonifractor sp. DFI.6.63]|nr:MULTISPECIES: hypothetical protein [Oscillospiraceae]MCQ5030939.1 hypothetical protein [Flavonifractor sp. DFI.6.63]MDU2194509.1 hypothetical protein [Clostridiales bacterium]MDY2978279.1 hypothetical protein [Oscillospiraceae bacterium]
MAEEVGISGTPHTEIGRGKAVLSHARFLQKMGRHATAAFLPEA